MKTNGIQDWIYKEVQDLSNIFFRFKEKPVSVANYVSKLAGSMHRSYPKELTLSGPYLLKGTFDEKAIASLFDLLDIHKFRLILVCANELDLQEKRIEKWYGTEYCVIDLPTSLEKVLFDSFFAISQSNSFK